MNVNQKIENALSEMVSKNIWPLSCPLEALPQEFIVYLSEEETPVEFGDNDDLEWMHYMEVNWYKKGDSRKPVNYIGIRKKIRKALKNAGFSVTNIIPFYEKDTGYTHLTFLCNIPEEDPYGEVQG